MAKLALVGKGASGKTYLLDVLVKRGYKPLVSHTSRPPRDGEVNGKTYHFVSKEEFEDMVARDMFVEYQIFNGWYYGTTKEEWDNADIMILSPEGVKDIVKSGRRKDVFIIYLNAPTELRLQRMKARGDMVGDTIERRINADEEAFKDYTDYDLLINDYQTIA